MTTTIETKRLTLSTWEDDDAKAYFNINQDPKVIEYLLGSLSMEQVRDFISMVNTCQNNYGYAFWAARLRITGELIGFIGLNYVDWPAHFTPAVEIGWRLGSQYWGQGLATEGALATLDYGFNQCQLPEIVSFTVPANRRSMRVMEKIGLKRDLEGDFAHPKLATDHPLSRHILYRLMKDEFLKKNARW